MSKPERQDTKRTLEESLPKPSGLPFNKTKSEHSDYSNADSETEDSETEEVAKKVPSTPKAPPGTVPARGSPVALPSRFGSPQSPTNTVHNQFQEPLKLARQLTFLLERLSKQPQQSTSITKVISNRTNKELRDAILRNESLPASKPDEKKPTVPREPPKFPREPPKLIVPLEGSKRNMAPIDHKKSESPLGVKTPESPLGTKIPIISKIPVLEEKGEANREKGDQLADGPLPITAPNLSLLLASHAFKDTPEGTPKRNPVDSWLGRVEKPTPKRVPALRASENPVGNETTPVRAPDKETPVQKKLNETQVITMSQVQACSTPVTTKPRNIEIIDSTFSPIPVENARNISPLTTRSPLRTRSRRFSESHIRKAPAAEEIFLLRDIIDKPVIPAREELRKDSFFAPPEDLKLLSRSERIQRFMEITERDQWDTLWISE
ncbi:hypothetical protein AA313_de0203289 [Arthrobotrys entomopaga]|nr:hypothetical protein AA313_de0203289 [Arthrobotrys entomopaga]